MPIRKGARGGAILPPTERDMKIIRAVDRHGPMTHKHLWRLFFGKQDGLTTPQAAWRRLKVLVDRGYLTATRLPAQVGSGPYVYQLGKAAISLLNEDGGTRRVPRRRIETVAAVLHGLEAVDFYVTFREALEARGGEMITWMGEREVQYSLIWEGKRLSFTPDAYGQWAAGAYEGAFYLELDRGTESITRIAQKMETYEAYYTMRAYRDHLDEVGLQPQILFIVVDQRREQKITRWLRRRIDQGRLSSLPTILVATRDAAMRDVLGPVWSTTKSDARVPLVEGLDEPETDELGEGASNTPGSAPDRS